MPKFPSSRTTLPTRHKRCRFSHPSDFEPAASLKLETFEIENAERGKEVEISGQTHIANEPVAGETEAARLATETEAARIAAETEAARLAAEEETWRDNALLTIHINHHLDPIKVKPTIAADGISLNFLLANAVPDSVTPTFGEISILCKQLSSESIKFAGREVYEFVGVLWYSIVAYILGT